MKKMYFSPSAEIAEYDPQDVVTESPLIAKESGTGEVGTDDYFDT